MIDLFYIQIKSQIAGNLKEKPITSKILFRQMPQIKLHETISTCHHQNITKNQFFSSTFGSTNFQNLSGVLQIKRVSKLLSNSL